MTDMDLGGAMREMNGHARLDEPIDMIRGIAEKRAALLAKLRIVTLRDLLLHIPVRYEDRTMTHAIGEVKDGDECAVEAAAAAPPVHSRPRRTLSVWRLLVSDGTGFMNITWFNQDFAVRSIRAGDKILFFGTVKRAGTRIEMTNPVFEIIREGESGTGRVMPVYGLTEGVSQNQLRSHVREALKMTEGIMEDWIPADMRVRHGLTGWMDAVRTIHFPEREEDARMARRRLTFDELLELQVGIRVQRGASLRKGGIPMARDTLSDLRDQLPYQLTPAQEKVLGELLSDMEKPVAMNRLLQGDVGSGKTVVAFMAAVSAIRAGYQAVLMVPTEILADQHKRAAEILLGGLPGPGGEAGPGRLAGTGHLAGTGESAVKGMSDQTSASGCSQPSSIRICCLKGGMGKRERSGILSDLAAGGPDLVIGTHALLTGDVAFARLGLVITDEQHRFGVRQRAMLSAKGVMPHMLVMTATPIPRTLSLLLYGDLDISVLDGLPPGRKPIRTFVVDESMRARIEAFIRKKVSEGRQAYVVCPLVEESEEMQAESAVLMAQKLREHVYPDLRIGLIHGQMKSKDKDAVMVSFSSGMLDILVATTVIEVGVNVPNACVMVIENAERFGLSQLHQLRGRVGRGAEQSHCILFKGGGGKTASERLSAIAATQDGFVLAEQDLKLRGPGEAFGTRQHGLPECRIANLYADLDLMQAARDEAILLAGPASRLQDDGSRELRNYLLHRFASRIREIAMN